MIFVVAFAVLVPLGVLLATLISDRITGWTQRACTVSTRGPARHRSGAGGRRHQARHGVRLGRWAGRPRRRRRALVRGRGGHSGPRGIVAPVERRGSHRTPIRVVLGRGRLPARRRRGGLRPLRIDLGGGCAHRPRPRRPAAPAARAVAAAVSVKGGGPGGGWSARGAAPAGRPERGRVVVGRPRTARPRSSSSSTRTSSSGPPTRCWPGDALLVDVLSQYGVGSIYFLAGAFQRGADRQRHARPRGGSALGADVHRHLRHAAPRGRHQARGGGVDGRRGHRAGVRAPVPAGGPAAARRHPLRPAGGRDRRGRRRGTPAPVDHAGARAPAGHGRHRLRVGARVVRVHVADRGRVRRPVRRDAAGRRTPPRDPPMGRCTSSPPCLVGHLVLAGSTLAIAGELPRWGWYLDTLREFLFGPLGDLTYDFSSFSPGLAVGALYMASAVGPVGDRGATPRHPPPAAGASWSRSAA